MPDQTPSMPPLPDSRLLELAAKAADLPIEPCTCGHLHWPFKHVESAGKGRGHWNPLHNDGDALRLAAKLRIDIEWQNVGAFPCESVEAYHRDGDHGYFCAAEHENDYRRAIVRAAAEIGARISTLSLE